MDPLREGLDALARNSYHCSGVRSSGYEKKNGHEWCKRQCSEVLGDTKDATHQAGVFCYSNAKTLNTHMPYGETGLHQSTRKNPHQEIEIYFFTNIFLPALRSSPPHEPDPPEQDPDTIKNYDT